EFSGNCGNHAHSGRLGANAADEGTPTIEGKTFRGAGGETWLTRKNNWTICSIPCWPIMRMLSPDRDSKRGCGRYCVDQNPRSVSGAFGKKQPPQRWLLRYSPSTIRGWRNCRHHPGLKRQRRQFCRHHPEWFQVTLIRIRKNRGLNPSRWWPMLA